MAETLDTRDMLANTFEPKRKFRFIMAIDGIDAYTLKTAARPQITFEDTTMDWMNAKRFISGKGTWNPIQITTHDPIAPSAAVKVMDWVRLNYEPLTGRMGYATYYKKDIQLKVLDPQGSVVELWDLQGAWPQDINFGELDYASSDPVEINFSLRFDNAVLQF
jgi:hypothetical protein